MKFKLLLSLITTLVYTNTFIASATELSDVKHSKSIFDENMQVNIEEKIISDLKDILLKNGGQEMLSKFINKYDLKCTTESFSKKLKVGARECQLENKESNDGVPLLMLGIENDKIIATICPATVAIAAPANPIFGAPSSPKISIGSRIIFIIAPIP